ncbi:MAG: J domain-containing protein [Planctomycetota bacterium]
MTDPLPNLESEDPREVLGLARDACSPEAARCAYRRLLRVYRPEAHPAAFRKIRAAYEALAVGAGGGGPPRSGGHSRSRPRSARRRGDTPSPARRDAESLGVGRLEPARPPRPAAPGCRGWAADVVEMRRHEQDLATAAERIRGRTGWPDGLVALLRDQHRLTAADLVRVGRGLFSERQLFDPRQRQWAAQVQREAPLLWSAWTRLRGRLVDQSLVRRSWRGAPVEAADAMERAWATVRAMDAEIDAAALWPRRWIIGGTALVVALWGWFGVAAAVAGAVGVVAVVLAVVGLGDRRALYGHVLPRLHRAAVEGGVTVADVTRVLIERGEGLRNWREVHQRLPEAVGLWLWSTALVHGDGASAAAAKPPDSTRTRGAPRGPR